MFRSMEAKNVEFRSGLSKSLVLLLVFSKVSATHINTFVLECQAIYYTRAMSVYGKRSIYDGLGSLVD
jgi:hypothetical protein